MQTAITARHFELTDQLRQYVMKKVEKLERYSDYIISTEIVLAKDSGQDLVEGKVHLKHEVLTARAQTQDLVQATNEVVERLLTQMKRHDERMKDRKKQQPK